MKRILVPCDFSKQSQEAYKIALDFASKSKGEITLLYVLQIPTLYDTGFAGEVMSYDPVFFTKMEGDAKKELEKMKSKADAKSIKIKTEVVYGDFILSIKKMIETHKIDIIVMGTTGSSGLSEIFIGSNTEKVVRFSPIPVLAVRKAFESSKVKNILLPSVLGLDQTEFVGRVKELQDFFGATLHILLVNTPTHFRRDAEAQEALNEFVKHYKLKNYKTHFQNFRREEDGIIDFAHTEKMDLIAMATHARKGLSHLFNSSITENVVNHIQSPIWTSCLKS
jgi:nucleotide-binding universal stress UspA family protein